MFTYLCLGTSDLGRSIRFYDPVMAALGHRRCVVGPEEAWDGWAGWGTYEDQGARELALWVCPPFDRRAVTVANGSMIALRATRWQQVDEFHAAAIRFGGASEGAPGLRPQYQPDFYAAYVRDPDGHKLAAVCRGFTARPAS